MKKLMVAIAGAVALACSAFADVVPWFNGGVAAGFPTDQTMSGGVWSNVADQAAWTGEAVTVDADEATPLTFEATDKKTLDDVTTNVVFESMVKFEPSEDAEDPAVSAEAKAGIVMHATDGFKFLTADGWVTAGVEATNEAVTVKVELFKDGDDTKVRYTIGDVASSAYTANASGAIQTTSYVGDGEIKSLSATYAVNMVTFTVADITGASFVVSNNNEQLTAPFKAVVGSDVVVTYTANDGYLFKDGTTSKQVTVPAAAGELDTGVVEGDFKEAEAKIGTALYLTLKAAVDAATDGATVELLASCEGAGVQIAENKFATSGLTVDFGGFTYTATTPAVGSSGTQNQVFQLLKGNNITFTNGTIEVGAAYKESFRFIVQNYANLTLAGMTLDGTNLDITDRDEAYTLSNNNGTTLIKDSRIIDSESGTKTVYAFDVCGYKTYGATAVTVVNSTIDGDIQVADDANHGISLALTSGTFNGDLVLGTGADKATITKAKDVELDPPEGYKWNDFGQLVQKGFFFEITDSGNQYETLAEALAEVEDCGTIKLLKDITTVGITIDSPEKGFTLDFDGHTYTVAGCADGQEEAFNFAGEDMGVFVTFCNGTICCTASNKDCTWHEPLQSGEIRGITKLIQNSAVDLNLNGMTLDGKNLAKAYCGTGASRAAGPNYTLSTSCSVSIGGEGTISARDADGFAFKTEVWGRVTVQDSNTCIDGNIDLGGGDLDLSVGTCTGLLKMYGSTELSEFNAPHISVSDDFVMDRTLPCDNSKWADDEWGDGVKVIKRIFEYGAGTENSPYQIEDLEDLQSLQTWVNVDHKATTNRYFTQTVKNIDLAGTPWSGIGTSTSDPLSSFCGTYDGQDYKISNVTFTRQKYSGFFKAVRGATIMNLTIDMAGFATEPAEAEEWGGAAFVGQSGTNGVTCINLKATGFLTNANHNVAGIAVSTGGVAPTDVIRYENCVNEATVATSYTKAGGIVAFANTKCPVVFSGCVNKGSVEANPTEKSGDCSSCGGIIGWAAGDGGFAFENCSSEGTVSTMTNSVLKVGSFVGEDTAYATTITISGCTTTNLTKRAVGNASANTAKYAGFMFAEVEDGVATFVAKAEVGGDYMVMAKGAAVVLAAGESITLDETLATCAVSSSAGEGYELVHDGNTYTVQAILPGVKVENYEGADTPADLEAAFAYTITNTPAYRDWNVDYFVSFDKDIAANTVTLKGQYGQYSWTGKTIDAALSAGTEIQLVPFFTDKGVTVDELFAIQPFKCGVGNNAPAQGGTKVTVVLKMFKAGEEDVVLNTTTYTFEAKAEPLDPTQNDKIECEDETQATVLAAAITLDPASYVKAPAVVTNPVDAAAYPLMYQGRAYENYVFIELTDAAIETLEAQVSTNTVTETVAAALVNPTATEATISGTTAGFYYWIEGSDTPDFEDSVQAKAKLATATGESLTLVKPEEIGVGGKQFYKIAVGTMDPNPEN